MLLINRLQNPMSTDLSRELLNLCSEDMSTVADKLRLEGNFPYVKISKFVITT